MLIGIPKTDEKVRSFLSLEVGKRDSGTNALRADNTKPPVPLIAMNGWVRIGNTWYLRNQDSVTDGLRYWGFVRMIDWASVKTWVQEG